jgi:hypothetical protein
VGKEKVIDVLFFASADIERGLIFDKGRRCFRRELLAGNTK